MALQVRRGQNSILSGWCTFMYSPPSEGWFWYGRKQSWCHCCNELRIIDARRNRTGIAVGSCQKVVQIMYFVSNGKMAAAPKWQSEYKPINCSLISCFTSEEGCHLSLAPLCSIASALLWVFPALHSSLMMFAARSNWWHPLQSSH